MFSISKEKVRHAGIRIIICSGLYKHLSRTSTHTMKLPSLYIASAQLYMLIFFILNQLLSKIR